LASDERGDRALELANLPAILLAAGRGERLRPLTDHTPKPLLAVRGKRLIEWHLEALARAGVRQVVINTAWLEDQFPAVLGDGSAHGLRIDYSMEGRRFGAALETGGGIAQALPQLGEAFWVVSGDVFVPGFAFEAADAQRFLAGDRLAELWMVPNPAHRPQGDFGIDAHGLAVAAGTPAADGSGPIPTRTWSCIGLCRAALFDGVLPGTRLPLRPLLDAALARRRLGARAWDGDWADVGTPERLAELEHNPDAR